MNTAKTILVTGGSGYLASWIVKSLLAEGHHVRATVRRLADRQKYQHLENLEPGRGSLALFEAGLQEPGSFAAAMAGCDYVIHTASPFVISGVKDPQAELIAPAVDGVRNVLESVNRTDSVRRVVLTSSVVAIYGDSCEARGRGAFTEADWNRTSSAEHQPYSFSKTLAEKAAWSMAGAQKRWDLVVLHPGFMLGPAVDPATSGMSNTTMRNFANGTYKSGIIDAWYGLVDVRDAARAHLNACFTPAAGGRYIISNRSASLLEIAEILRREFGGRYPLPKRKVPKPVVWLVAPAFGFTRKYITKNVGFPIQLDNRRSLQELGLTYTPIETTIRDHFLQVIS